MPMPFKQPSLIGVSRKPIQCVDFSSDRKIVAKYVHWILAIDNLPRQSSLSGEADENHAALFAGNVVFEVVAHASSSGHAGPS